MLIGYARVSTKEQNLDLQTDNLKQQGCEKIFIEKVSAASKQRPELEEALKYARKGDTFVVWKMDRLARSLKQLIETVESLAARDIGFLSITENIDTTSAGGKLIFHIFGALAEFEREIIRDRTKAGLEAARERNRFGGRPKVMGEKEIQMAKTMLKDPNINVVDIAKQLGVSTSTLYRHIPGGRDNSDL
jgi:DNA invertase Pin-like site-specific DNA recombinase